LAIETRLFLFPVTGTDQPANCGGRNPTSFVGAIAVRQTWPHLQVAADPQLITHFLLSLLPPQSLCVLTLQRGVNREDVLAYFHDRLLAYRSKEELLEFEDPVRFSPLSPLLEGPIVDSQFIFRSAARDDLGWAIRRYGSLDRLRVFAVAETEADEFQNRLAMPSSAISYDDVLDQAQFVGLFDYDWDYFFCFSRKMSAGRLVSDFRNVCQREGVVAETVTDQALLRKVFRRAGSLLGLPMVMTEP
jgi:hypothetical protein